jgi:hypothetical protein
MLLLIAQPSTFALEKAPNDYFRWLNNNNNKEDLLADEYTRYIAQPQVTRVK